MGCDIHMVTEVRKGGKWQQAEPFIACTDCDGSGLRTSMRSVGSSQSEAETCYWCAGKGMLARYRGRNYEVFSVLGDVRNGNGEFAIPFIARNRGVPADATVKAEHCDCEDDCEHLNLGDHSFSWVGLAELNAYDWDASIPREGWVDEEHFKTFRAEGKPRSWSGGVFGGFVRHIGNSEMQKRIDDRSPELDRLLDRIAGGIQTYYTLVRWTEPVRDTCRSFVGKFVPALNALCAREGVTPDDVRIVFGFDS